MLGPALRLRLLLEFLNTSVALFQRDFLDQRRLRQYVKGVRSGADPFPNQRLGFWIPLRGSGIRDPVKERFKQLSFLRCHVNFMSKRAATVHSISIGLC